MMIFHDRGRDLFVAVINKPSQVMPVGRCEEIAILSRGCTNFHVGDTNWPLAIVCAFNNKLITGMPYSASLLLCPISYQNKTNVALTRSLVEQSHSG